MEAEFSADSFTEGSGELYAPSRNGIVFMAEFPKPLDKNASNPLWVQLRDQIVQDIRTGALAPEQKMPTVRDLSAELGVSASVVNQAYRYLRATGYLESRQGSGVRVRKRMDNVNDADFDKTSKLIDDFINGMVALGLPLNELAQSVSWAVAARMLDPDGSYSVMSLYEDIFEKPEDPK